MTDSPNSRALARLREYVENTDGCSEMIHRLWSEDAFSALAELEEQFEAAQRDLAIADQLAEWVRVTISVEGVFSNNLGAQAQAQGLANLLTRYAASRNSNPAKGSE